MVECRRCGTLTVNPSGWCDLEPESWEDTDLIKADRAKPVISVQFNVREQEEPRIITRIIQLPDSAGSRSYTKREPRQARVASATGHWEQGASGWTWVN